MILAVSNSRSSSITFGFFMQTTYIYVVLPGYIALTGEPCVRVMVRGLQQGSFYKADVLPVTITAATKYKVMTTNIMTTNIIYQQFTVMQYYSYATTGTSTDYHCKSQHQ